MPKAKLFDNDSEEEEVKLKTENEYAKKYDTWREKEELHKLEQKYGSKALSSDVSASSDSEEESDEPPEVPEEMEAQFLKTLALLKTKDPRIYDPNFKAFDEKVEKEEEKKPKEKTLTFDDSDSDEDNDGNIFTIEKKAEIKMDQDKPARQGQTMQSASSKGDKLKEYLTGEAEHADDELEKDLAPLRALWSDPSISEGEAFLRDYILNKSYLEEGDEGEAKEKIRDDEELEEDEKRVEEQGQFERAYNFRFEEPDQEYLKRYPRTMNYIRPKDDRRARKRAEIRTRKEEEKKRKMEEIARMKALKLKEIQQKIAKIKEVTGNDELAFKEEDIEGDFDPEEHDRRMKVIFDEQYYGEADDEKPVFPDLDEELEIENWDNYDPEAERGDGGDENDDGDGPHCEDDDFNMDADYDPKRARANLMEEIQRNLGKKKRHRKKKSKLARLLATEKPKYVPTVADKTYDEYMEEYYAMDCEDIIAGEIPTRFKYRQVVPNDYGLSVEEILLADDKELTQWVPLKKIVRHRPVDVEKSEVKTYQHKAADERLKRKILPSLFKDLPEEPEVVVPIGEATKKKKKKKKNKQEAAEQTDETATNQNAANQSSEEHEETAETSQQPSKKKKKKHRNIEDTSLENDQDNSVSLEHEERDTATNQSTKKKKRKHSETELFVTQEESNNDQSRSKKKKMKDSETTENAELTNKVVDEIRSKKTKDKKNNTHISHETGISEVNADVNSVGINKESKKRKKKHKSDSFVVECVDGAGPSNKGHLVGNTENKCKHKNQSNQNVKSGNDHKPSNNKKNKKDFKQKFKQNDKFKNKKQGKETSDNPLSKLSDERLKAYGLNPKKYRSFLKYKKF